MLQDDSCDDDDRLMGPVAEILSKICRTAWCLRFLIPKNVEQWGSSSHFDAWISDIYETTTFSASNFAPPELVFQSGLAVWNHQPVFDRGSNDNAAQRRCCGCWPRSARQLASLPPGLHQNRPKRRSAACNLSWVKCAWKTCSFATRIFLQV